MVLNSAAQSVDNKLVNRRRTAMNLNFVMRYTYLLAWAAFVIAIIYRALQMLGMAWAEKLPVGSRGVLFLSGFLVVATIATAAYSRAQGSPGK